MTGYGRALHVSRPASRRDSVAALARHVAWDGLLLAAHALLCRQVAATADEAHSRQNAKAQ